jgi:hypothetical protein
MCKTILVSFLIVTLCFLLLCYVFYYYVMCSFVSLSILIVMCVPLYVFSLTVLFYDCSCVNVYCTTANGISGDFSTTLTEGFPFFFLSCKTNTTL